MLLWAILGYVVGVFINWLSDALPLRQLLGVPRCANCQQPRAPLQWSGLLAYATGQARCRHCGARIAWRWLLVEVIATLMFAYLFVLFDFSLPLLIVTLYSTILLLVCVIDFEHRLILHVVMFPSILAALALAFLTPNLKPLNAIAGGVAGLLLTGLVYLGGVLFVRVQARRGRIINEVAFGQGDVILMLFVGLITGLDGVLRAFVLGILLGGIVAAGILVFGLVRRQSTLYIPYAYGPYLAAAGWYVLLQNAISTR